MAAGKSSGKKPTPWSAFPHHVEVTVRWRDLDAYNHVTNSVYFNYFEEARISIFGKIPYFKRISEETRSKFGSTLVHTECSFKSQAFLSDRLVVAVRFLPPERMYLETEYSVFNRKTGGLIATGKASNVLIDIAKFRPIRLPEELIAEVKKLC